MYSASGETTLEVVSRSGSAQAHQFLKEFCDWSQIEPRITTALLIGSYARGAARPNSDVDIVIFSSSPQALLNDSCWDTQFGTPGHRTVYLDRPLPALTLQYTNGLEVELGITDIDWREGTNAAAITRILAYSPALVLYPANTEPPLC